MFGSPRSRFLGLVVLTTFVVSSVAYLTRARLRENRWVKGLGDADANLRAESARLLIEDGTERAAIPILEGLVDDRRFGDSAIDALLGIFDDSRPAIRTRIIDGLARLGATEQVRPAIDLVDFGWGSHRSDVIEIFSGPQEEARAEPLTGERIASALIRMLAAEPSGLPSVARGVSESPANLLTPVLVWGWPESREVIFSLFETVSARTAEKILIAIQGRDNQRNRIPEQAALQSQLEVLFRVP